jgi:hypothetical protein
MMAISPEDRIREIASLPKRTVQVDPNPNKAVLAPEQYPMAEIVTNTGQTVMVYTGGPLAGQDENGNFPIQASATIVSGDDEEDDGNGNGGGGGAGGGGGGGTPQDNSKRQSAYDILLEEFKRYGLESLVTPLKELITDPTISESEFSLKLRGSKAYTDRFKANEARIGKGLRALSEADYIRLEDQYQNIMRNYGMPASYYAKGELGRQQALEKFIAADVSATELEDRIMTAQERVIRGAPQIAQALKEFYPEITNGDILAYALDPANAMKEIQRKVTAAEIGGAALQQTGLTTSVSRAEELQRMGVDKKSATAGYSTIGGGLQRGSELASIYGESPYTQATAESEIFKLTGEQEARKQRQKVTGLEKATFGGQSGVTTGALARDRAGGI